MNKIEIPDGKRAEWVNGVLTLVDEQPKTDLKFKIGDKAILNKDIAFKQGNAVSLISAGTEVEIVFVSSHNPNYYEAHCGTAISVVHEKDLAPYIPKDITERIKTLEDAVKWCKENGRCDLYEQYADALNVGLQRAKDILAYLKLRIITCALNEGWEPKFEKGEWRWYAWYDFLTNAELDEMTEEEIKERGICRVVGRAYNNADANGGLVCSYAHNVSSVSYAGHGSRLAFKSKELAEYAAKQFIEIYADYCFTQK